MSGNWTRKSENSCYFEPFAPLSDTSLGVGSKCERACSALCYGLYCTTVREPTALPRRNRLSKIGACLKNDNLCSVLYMGTNAINTARPSTPRSNMPQRGERQDTPSSSIARAVTAGYRCRWHRRSGSYSRQSGETARREQRSNRKRK